MYWLLKFFSVLACKISNNSAETMGKVLGNLLWIFVPRKRKKLSEENIWRAGITYDIDEVRLISKRAALRFGNISISMFRFPLLTKNNINKYINIKGKKILDNVLADGTGCILAANHCGNWEMEGAALALYGYPILAVGMKQSNRGFDRFLREYRTMVGQTVEYKTGVRNIYKRLKEGYFVGLLCDQDPGHTGILSPFLGQQTLTPTGPAHLAIMTGLPIIPIFIHTIGKERYELVVEEPITIPTTRNKKEAIQMITDQINQKLETWIRTYPEEWFWLHNRWKHTDKLYPYLRVKK